MVRTHATVILGLLTWAMSPVLGAQSEKEPALWFPVGEELVYRVKWGIIPVGTSMAEVERSVLQRTLDHFGGDKEATARALGISSRTIYRKLAEESDESGSTPP